MEDADSNHLGLNINSIKSISQVPLRSYGVELLSGTNVKVIVEYDGNLKRMNIFVSMSNGTEVNTKNPTLSVDIDLTKHLPEDAYVGFSASTGSQVELNCVKVLEFQFYKCYLVWKREENKKKRPDPYIIHRLESSTASKFWDLPESKFWLPRTE
ncbi:probable L-type lectin-domain containing receptor kinase S.5 [Papaver somniferum]|uniref:probable L-type lectin-domain containing receptor kinase S.5 n=1 Tax=Papaver somniferum TaxID=3469 RepID=UPI000E6FB320|nr:probable L-type lectin-domain containing receptor kinase S.5 [Papaver somniferum]